MRILPRIGRIAWVLRSRACLAEPPALSPSTMNNSVPGRIVVRAVGELAGQAQLARGGRGLALDLALGACAAAARPSGRGRRPSSARPRSILSARKWSKWSRTAASTSRAASGLVSRSLVWLWNCGSRMNTESMISAPVDDVLGLDVLGLLLADQLGEGAHAPGQRRAQPLLVGAAVGGRDGVAIIGGAALAPQRPGDRPFDRALAVREILAAGEEVVGRAFALADLLLQMVGEAAGELEHRLGRRVVARSASGSQCQRISTPANR